MRYNETGEPTHIRVNSNSGSPLYQYPFTLSLYKPKFLMNEKFPHAALNQLLGFLLTAVPRSDSKELAKSSDFPRKIWEHKNHLNYHDSQSSVMALSDII